MGIHIIDKVALPRRVDATFVMLVWSDSITFYIFLIGSIFSYLPTLYLHRYIIGKKGEMKKKLETETRTSISIPKLGEEGAIGEL